MPANLSARTRDASTHRRSRGLVIRMLDCALLGGLLLGGCECWPTAPSSSGPTVVPLPDSEIEAIDIFPSQIHVLSAPTSASPPARFRLRARPKNGDGEYVRTSTPVQWKFTLNPSALGVEPVATGQGLLGPATVADVEIKHLSSGNETLEVQAEFAGGSSVTAGTAIIQLYASQDAALTAVPGDLVSTTAAVPPDAYLQPTALHVGQPQGAQCSGSVFAFVGAVPVGPVAGGACTHLSVFGPSKEALHQAGGSTSVTNLVNTSGGKIQLGQSAHLKVPIRVHIAVTDEDGAQLQSSDVAADAHRLAANQQALGDADADVKLVNQLYEMNRAGIRFEAVFTYVGSAEVSDLSGIPSVPDRCKAPHVTDPKWYATDTINVYYIDKLFDDAQPVSMRGVYCDSRATIPWARDFQSAPVIYISANTRAGTTLAHELGHALSLGHEQNINNIMNGMGGIDAEARTRFRVGQDFWMNFHSTTCPGSATCQRNWLYHAGETSAVPQIRSNAFDCWVDTAKCAAYGVDLP